MKVQFISSLTAAAIIHIHFPEKGGYQLNSLTPYTVRMFLYDFLHFLVLIMKDRYNFEILFIVQKMLKSLNIFLCSDQLLSFIL
jgi:hypothetical protein